MTIVLGLTGSIATGKSTVAKLLKKEGIPIIDADQISRQIVEPGNEAYQRMVSAFGHDILATDQSIDRKKLAEIIFNNQEKRDQLNEIVHPIIIAQMIKERDRLIAEDHRLIILDIPLLFELKLMKLVEKVIVVYTSPEQQLERLQNRDDLTEEQARQRITSQMSIDEKAKRADFIIDNNDSKQETTQQCYRLIAHLEDSKKDC